MPRLARSLLAVSFALASGAALAAASSTPFGYVPDPALRTDSPAQLQARIRRACGVTQARVQNVSTGQVERGCGCYATRVMKALDASEIATFRTTGIFSDSARGKAIAAIDACRLRRPV